MMKRPFSAIAVTVLMVGLGAAAHASSYQFKVPLKGIAPPADWQPHEPLYGDWEDVGDVFGCSNWAPAPMTVAVGQAFTQTATDCQQDQARTVQPRERDTHSGSIRNVGEPFTETRTLTASATRDAVGTRETWSAAEAIYSVWTNSGEPYGCTNWAPAASTIAKGQTFTQTATDCKQDQTRTRQDREYEPTLGQYRNIGAPVTETRTVTASSTRSATGTKAQKVCVFNESNPTSMWWFLDGTGNNPLVMWNGEVVDPNAPRPDGKTYTRGKHVKTATSFGQISLTSHYYEICLE